MTVPARRCIAVAGESTIIRASRLLSPRGGRSPSRPDIDRSGRLEAGIRDALGPDQAPASIELNCALGSSRRRSPEEHRHPRGCLLGQLRHHLRQFTAPLAEVAHNQWHHAAVRPEPLQYRSVLASRMTAELDVATPSCSVHLRTDPSRSQENCVAMLAPPGDRLRVPHRAQVNEFQLGKERRNRRST